MLNSKKGSLSKGINQKFSGHRQLQSVQHYRDANEEMVKNAVELLV